MTLYFALPFLPGGNLEWFIVVMAALMVFGARLPEVVLRGVAQVMRVRAAIAKMWRDTGLEDELRRVRRDIEMSIPRDADFNVTKKPAVAAKAKGGETNDARAAAERAREAAAKHDRVGQESEGTESQDTETGSVDPDAHRRGAFELKPANDTIAHGDVYLDPPDLKPDPWSQDQVPGADRQEPGVVEDESSTYWDDSDAAWDDHEQEGAQGDATEPDLVDDEPDLGGSHFGAGVKKAPKGPA